MSNPNSLVARVLKSKYFANGDFLHSSLGTRPSYAWRSILHGRDLLCKGLVRDIGNGESSNVWSVNWIIDPLPRPPNYRTDSVIDLTLKISDLLLPHSSSWDVTRLRQAFTDHDTEIILRLNPKLSQEDGYKWGFTKDGVYTSRSGYKLLDSLPDENGELQPALPPLEKKLWCSLWKIKAPAKIKHFLWKALAGAVAVMDRLRSRGIQVDPTCRVCNRERETICHLLFMCPMAKDVWERSLITLPPAGFSRNSIFLNLYHLLSQSSKNPMDNRIKAFLWIIWHLWKARNKLAFEGSHYSSVSVLSKAQEEANVWWEINFPQVEEHPPQLLNQRARNSWSKPPRGTLKCNFGVSWVDSQSPCGAAWILRDDKGKTILHSRRSLHGVGSEREAELLTVQWVVDDMINTHQQRIIFESSCALARDTFLNPMEFRALLPLTNDISCRLHKLDVWSFQHCVQDKNTIAQDIAVSVTAGHRYQSYIARGEPSWLLKRIVSEAEA